MMFAASLKILCESLKAVKVSEPTRLLQGCTSRLTSTLAPRQGVVCQQLQANSLLQQSSRCYCEDTCGRKCEKTPPASSECPSICPPKPRVLPCSNKKHVCKKPKCLEKEKKPPCYPKKPKRPKMPPRQMHTMAGISSPLCEPTPGTSSAEAGAALKTSRGFHTAPGPLMAYQSPIQPCKNPPPGSGSMCCQKKEKGLKKKKCKKVCMPGCKPALHKRCQRKIDRKFERCCRILPPFPCFSECIREPLRKDPYSECNCLDPQSVCCQDQRRRRKRPPPMKCGCK